MVEPVTTGALVAGALATGASLVAHGALGEAGKEAYLKLKNLLASWAGGDVAQLEQEPDSKGRALVLAEAIDKQPPQDQADARALAEALRAALVSEGHGALVDNRVTVIATGGSIAAGRDVNVGWPPKPGGQ